MSIVTWTDWSKKSRQRIQILHGESQRDGLMELLGKSYRALKRQYERCVGVLKKTGQPSTPVAQAIKGIKPREVQDLANLLTTFHMVHSNGSSSATYIQSTLLHQLDMLKQERLVIERDRQTLEKEQEELRARLAREQEEWKERRAQELEAWKKLRECQQRLLDQQQAVNDLWAQDLRALKAELQNERIQLREERNKLATKNKDREEMIRRLANTIDVLAELYFHFLIVMRTENGIPIFTLGGYVGHDGHMLKGEWSRKFPNYVLPSKKLWSTT
ncbi:hypothetical protein BGW41_002539 [Actinomortierella wolfii]|nr:hypothetical protein BGW41_002539 [Actinomortierella wolfii]